METLIEIPELEKIGKSQWLKVLEYTLPQQEEIEQLIENEIWITAQRKSIFVRSMGTGHIKNCINCLEGNGKSKIPNGYLGGKEKWLKIFNKELTNRQ